MTKLRESALKLHRVHKIVKKEYKLVQKCTKYVKRGYFDGDAELLMNRQTAATAYGNLLQIETKLVNELQREIRGVGKVIEEYSKDGIFGLIYMVGALTELIWVIITALILGI